MGGEGLDLIEEMRQAYHDIPVPEDAERMVRAGIARARREGRAKKAAYLARRSGMSAAAALLAITVMANISQVTASAMEGIPMVGAIAKVVTFRTFEDSRDNYEAKIEVPTVSIDGRQDVAANRSIEAYARGLIDEYEKEVAGGLEGAGHYSVTSTYEVVTDTARYLSLRINTTVAMGSGAESAKIFTIDKSTGDVVGLDDLFRDRPEALAAVSDEIRDQMEAQMEADSSKTYFLDAEGEPGEGFHGLAGDEGFYFNQSGELVLVFNEYAVAPGYMGVVEFTIPREVTGVFNLS